MAEQVQQQVQKIEGISPEMLWTFCIVLVGIAALIVLGYKVIEIFRKEHERKVQRQQLNGQDITDKIAAKVTEKVNSQIDEKFKNFERKFDKKFEDIDKKLASDKETLEIHTAQLNAEKARVDRLDNDSKALCHGMFALLAYQVNGQKTDKLIRTEEAMKNYLIDGTYREEDWK